MLRCYSDILDKIPEPPTWFDESGVPRYEPFHPSRAADFYADEVALIAIACQACEHRFHVSLSWKEHEKDRSLYYGDPPNIGCCRAGPTMSSISLEVLEYWKRNDKLEWIRVPELEKTIDDA